MFNQAIERLQRDWDTLINEADIETAPNNKAGMLAAASQLNDSIAFLKNAQIGGFGALVAQVRQWGVDKGLTGPTGKATVEGQMTKLSEEFAELAEGLLKQDQHEVVDAVGDMTVVLILLSELAGFKFETALRAAYDVIKNRTGRMAADGTFVKDKP
jgi:NTP pyrophosphatase (non-canonical NTP hydrolase)